jgi:hypothetical protein
MFPDFADTVNGMALKCPNEAQPGNYVAPGSGIVPGFAMVIWKFSRFYKGEI